MEECNGTIKTYSCEFITGLRILQAVDKVQCGRPRSTYILDDIIFDEIYEVQALFLKMKNDGWTWEMIAEAVTTDTINVSAPLVRKVALGICQSPKVEAALGLREEEATVPLSLIRKFPRRVNRTPRKRYRFEVTKEMLEAIDKQAAAHGMTRAEFLAHMLKVDRELARMGDGFGELEY